MYLRLQVVKRQRHKYHRHPESAKQNIYFYERSRHAHFHDEVPTAQTPILRLEQTFNFTFTIQHNDFSRRLSW